MATGSSSCKGAGCGHTWANQRGAYGPVRVATSPLCPRQDYNARGWVGRSGTGTSWSDLRLELGSEGPEKTSAFVLGADAVPTGHLRSKKGKGRAEPCRRGSNVWDLEA